MIIDAIRNYMRQLRSFSPNARYLLATSIITGLSFSIYSLIFNLYIDARGYPRSFLGELQSMPNLIALFSALPAGVLVDRMGRKNALYISGAGWALAFVGIVLAPNEWWMRLSMITYGVSQSLRMVTNAPFMMENSTEEERDALFSASFGLQTLIGFIGTFVGGWLPTVFGDLLAVDIESATAYASTLVVALVLAVVAIVPIFFIEEKKGTTSVETRSMLPWRNLNNLSMAGRIFLPNIIISMGAAILIPYMNLFFKETYPISDKVLGVIFAVSSVITGVATLASPVLAGRWGRIRALVLTQLASIPFLWLIGFSGVFWVSAVSFWARAALMNMSNPLYSAFAMQQFTARERATVSGLMGMSWNLGWTIGPYVSGWMQQQPDIGFKPIFLITIGTYVVAVLLERAFFQRLDDEQRRAAFLKKKGIADLTPEAQ